MHRRPLLTGLVIPFAAAALAVALVAAGLGFDAIPYSFLLAVVVGFAFTARGVVPVWPRSRRGRGQAVLLVLVAGWVYSVVAAAAAAGGVVGVSAVEEWREAAEVGRYRRDLDALVAARAGVDLVWDWAAGNGLSFAAGPAAALVDPPALPPPGVAVRGSSMVWRRGFVGGQRVMIDYYFRDDQTLARYELRASRPSL